MITLFISMLSVAVPVQAGPSYDIPESERSQYEGIDETDVVGGLVPCGNIRVEITTTNTDTGAQSGGDIVNPCNFNYFILLVNKIVNFILFDLAIPIAAIMFCYAGFQLLFSGGNSGKMEKAKKIMVNVGLGLVLAAAAWLIIHLVSEILGYDGSWIGF